MGQYKVASADGALWDGIASITIGVVLAIIAFYLARSSRRLLLGEAANEKDVVAIREAINSHPNVIETVQFLTMHLAPKQILVNANINLKSELDYPEVVETINRGKNKKSRTES